MSVINAIDVSLETALLKNLSEKEVYDKYINFVDMKRLLPNTALMLHDYKKYYEMYPDVKSINWGEFYTSFAQLWHAKDMEVNDVEYYRDYVLPAVQAHESDDIDKCMLGLIQKSHINDITQALQSGLDVEIVRKMLEKYEQKLSVIVKSVDKDVVTLRNANFSVLDKSLGIPWFMPSLQKNLMSLTKGQFVVVSADWGSGKSAFVISQLVKTLLWAQKTKDTRPIIYFNSEGTQEDVLVRMLSCLYKDKVLGGFEEVFERIDEVREKFEGTFDIDKLMVYQISETPTIKHVEQKIKKYGPSLAIIDICDRLAPEGDPNALKKLYDDCRVLAGVTCPIIGTSQSGDTSYYSEKEKKVVNDKWLNGSKTYGSKTGKPGAADTIITIGKEDEDSDLRFINVPKKKRGKQVKITCVLEPQYSYFRELEF